MNAHHPMVNYYGTPPGPQYDAMKQLDAATLNRDMKWGDLRAADDEMAERAQECLQAGVPLPTVVRLLDDMGVRIVEMVGMLGVDRQTVYQIVDQLHSQD